MAFQASPKLGIPFTVLADGVLGGYRHKEPENRQAVLFVHGFTGDWQETWEAPAAPATEVEPLDEEAAQPPVSFPALIADDPEFRDFDAFCFSYRTTKLDGDSIDDVAIQLHDQIKNNLKGYRILLLAHSMGGLVCMRYVLNRLERGHRPDLLGLMMYGTPCSGVELVKQAKQIALALSFVPALEGVGKLAGWLLRRHPQITAVTPASEFIQDLTAQWVRRVVNGGDPGVESGRKMWLPTTVVTGTRDRVVPQDSGKGVYGELAWTPIPHTHIGLPKPTGLTDRRYQIAKTWARRCAVLHGGKVLSELRAASDRIWQAHEGRLVRNWRYRAEVDSSPQHPVDQEWIKRRFAPCRVKQCKYEVQLDSLELAIGNSFGTHAFEDAWDGTPAYVHQFQDKLLSESEKSRLYENIDSFFDGKSAEECWRAVFPKLELCIWSRREGSGKNAKWKGKVALAPAEVERDGYMLRRIFRLAEEHAGLVGQDVLFDLTYDSVLPAALSSFILGFPWLIHGCDIRVTAGGGPMSFFEVMSRLTGGVRLEVETQNEGRQSSAKIWGDALVLPDSQIEVRWGRSVAAPSTP